MNYSLFLVACGVALVALVSGQAASDCGKELETFRECQKKFIEQQREANRPEREKKQNDAKACFTKNGCKEPTFQEEGENKQGGSGKQGGGKQGGGNKGKCAKDVSEKARDIIHNCIEKKVGINLPEQHEDNQQRGGGEGKGHGGFGVGEQINSLCSTDQSKNDTRKCLRELNGQSKGDRNSEAEQRFNARCANKKSCFAKVSAICQQKINETKKAACDCAKSDLNAQAAQLNKDFDACKSSSNGGHGGQGGQGGHGGQGGQQKSFTDRMTDRLCSGPKDDRCDHPFSEQQKQGGGGRGGKGGQGHGQGQGKWAKSGGNS